MFIPQWVLLSPARGRNLRARNPRTRNRISSRPTDSNASRAEGAECELKFGTIVLKYAVRRSSRVGRYLVFCVNEEGEIEGHFHLHTF